MDHVEFGRYLAQQRELRGLSRDEVAQATKIPPTLIAALETGQVERLPSRVFVLNYVRAYAQVIGLAPEDAVLRYQEIPDESAAQAEAPAHERRQRARRRLALALGALLAGLLAVLLALALAGKLPRT